MHVEVEGRRSVYRASSDSFVSGESYARMWGAPGRDQTEVPQMDFGRHDVPTVVEVMARGN